MINAGLFSTSGEAVALRAVDVQGEVFGAHARVSVRQTYRNEERGAIEAIYTFPLPADAVLSGFAMTTGERRSEGVVQEREAAFRTYDDAIVAGHGAALVEQERANVFTATVGNLLPGEETVIELEYLQRVQADEGTVRWMIPTLVAPRYIPGASTGDRTAHGAAEPTDRVPDADRITPKIGAADYKLTLDLTLDVGRDIEVESPSHTLLIERVGRTTHVRFGQREVSLDRDVVVVARDAVGGPFSTLATHRAGSGAGVMSLGVVPDLFGTQGKSGIDVVFAIDTSGSMEGESIQEARAALRLCLRHLREGDRFNVVAFSDRATWLSRTPEAFSQRTLEAADRWVATLVASGGTELLAPMTDAVKMAPDGVVVLLTDGQVGNEAEILRSVLAARRSARVYSFGIGTNVSDALLRDLARHTRASVEFIHPGERIDEKVVSVFAKAVAPRVTDVRVEFEGVDAGEVAPATLPDLVDGEPWSVFARYDRPGVGRAVLRGTLHREPWSLVIDLDLPAEASRPALAKLWAAERVRDLEGATVTDPRRAATMKQRIIELSVEHGIASKYTSFVVVETRSGSRRTSGMPETRVVPVNAPAGWATTQRLDRVAASAKLAKRKQAMPQPRMVAASRGAPAGAPAPKLAATFGSMPAWMRAPASPPAMQPSPPPMTEAKAGERRAQVDANAIGGSFDWMETEKERGLSADDADDFAAMPSAAAPMAYAAPEAMEESVFFGELAKKAEIAAPQPVQTPAFDVRGLMQAQLASGLWNGANDRARLLATADALTALVGAGVTAAHAMYGAQVRKAVEAVVALVAGLASNAPALAAYALAAAYLASTGHRTRKGIEQAATGLSTLAGRFSDEAALTASLPAMAAAAR